ncbi:hypothetical protein KIN20_007273 [Parelaphostrongylus tenuis]|uniref:Potassium channel domain-containing protein n=1 Tax=Parelaphostrongylus tenuis TaxID=148309 RepID=A0AAD5M7T4_PARTN|nr:hypothetical protein KIN20_007273 [Parelaphostrongylus tenuis]
MVASRKAALEEAILNIAKEMVIVINDPEQTVTVQVIAAYLKTTHKTLLRQEAAYVGSTFYKDEDPNNHMIWTFGSSVFFSMSVFTTIGYAPQFHTTQQQKHAQQMISKERGILTFVETRSIQNSQSSRAADKVNEKNAQIGY